MLRAARSKRLGSTIAVAAAIQLFAGMSAHAQGVACALVSDDRNPPERILRCGDTLEVRASHDASYRLPDQPQARQPDALQLDRGAVIVEFHASKAHPSFQIHTPYAIAAVRGTHWAVDVRMGKTSTFVINGVVAVSRPQGGQTALLHAGDGADVAPDSGPIVVKQWAAARVRKLMARFGL
jgi:ferric-dicitrate binding protein FerR (iron transport regulator)